MRIVELSEENKKEVQENILHRSPQQFGPQEAIVREIIENVKANGDAAVFEDTAKFDKAQLSAENFEVTEAEIAQAYEEVDPALVDVIRKALVNIRDFHEKQKQNSWITTTEKGTILGQKVTPMQRVGVYVPGGKAAYPSSVLMNVVPAKTAGVEEVIMTTPCNSEGKVNPAVLVAAKEAGADRIFKVGGAQAIAALAYGTEEIPKCDKIVGPGNIYVATAKKLLYGVVDIGDNRNKTIHLIFRSFLKIIK